MGLGPVFRRGRGPEVRAAAAHRGRRRGARRARPGAACATSSMRWRSSGSDLNGRVPLIGFSGSPFTLACYMIEGGGSDDFRLVKSMLYSRPDLLHRILEVNARAVIAYLNAQIAAGAQAVMVFDTWGGTLVRRGVRGILARLLAPGDGGAHAHGRWPRRAANPLHQGRRPVAGGPSRSRVPMPWASTGRRPWAKRAAASGERVALQGNMDPMVLFGTRGLDRSRSAAHPGRLRQGSGTRFQPRPRHLAAHRSAEHVHALVEAVHALLPRGPRTIGGVKKNIWLDVIAYSHGSRSRAPRHALGQSLSGNTENPVHDQIFASLCSAAHGRASAVDDETCERSGQPIHRLIHRAFHACATPRPSP